MHWLQRPDQRLRKGPNVGGTAPSCIWNCGVCFGMFRYSFDMLMKFFTDSVREHAISSLGLGNRCCFGKTAACKFWMTPCVILFTLLHKSKVCDPHPQVMPQTLLSLVLALSWIGVACGMSYEAGHVRPTGYRFYDGRSIGVIVLCMIEG